MTKHHRFHFLNVPALFPLFTWPYNEGAENRVFCLRKLTVLAVCILVLSGCFHPDKTDDVTPVTLNTTKHYPQSTTKPKAYNGITDPLTLDQLSINKLTMDYFSLIPLVQQLIKDAQFAFQTLIEIEDQTVTEACVNGGHVTYIPSRVDNHRVLTLVYAQCDLGEQRLDGEVSHQIIGSAFELSVHFHAFQTITDSKSVQFDGDVITSVVEAPNDKAHTFNLLISKPEGEQIKFDNTKVATNRIQSANALTARIYYSQQGYADLRFDSQLLFQSDERIFPTSGGPIILHGADDATASLTLLDEELIKIELKNTNKVTHSAIMPLKTLLTKALPESGGEAPIARVTTNLSAYPGDSLIYQAKEITLDGSDSYDPEYALLAFDWKLIKSPDHSNAYLESITQDGIKLFPDRIGDYEIQLIVSDGMLMSNATTLLIHVDPGFSVSEPSTIIDFAVDGISEKSTSYYQHVETVLNAEDVSPSFIHVDYRWRIMSKPEGSQATLSSTNTPRISFTPDHIGDYEIGLTLLDGHYESEVFVHHIKAESFNTFIALQMYLASELFGFVGETMAMEMKIGSMFGPGAEETQWELISKPNNSAAELSVLENFKAHIIPDKPGDYVVEFTASNAVYTANPIRHVMRIRENDYFQLKTLNKLIVQETDPSTTNYQPSKMFMGDLDGDGLNDLVLSNNSVKKYGTLPSTGIHFGESLTNFSSATLNNFSNVKHVKDINGDGLAEIVAFQSDLETIQFYTVTTSREITNVYSRSFSEDYNVYSNAFFQDVNNDGLMELITKHRHQKQVCLSHQTESFIFSDMSCIKIKLDKYVDMQNILFHDVNSDNLLDLLVGVNELIWTTDGSTETINHLFYYPGNGDLTFGEQHVFLSGFDGFDTTFETQLIDLDADGDEDLVSVGGSATKIGIGLTIPHVKYWLKTDAGNYVYGESNESVFKKLNARTVNFQDFDNDGELDLILRGEIPTSFTVVYQTSTGKFNKGQKLDINTDYQDPNGILFKAGTALVDHDNDGDTDILLTGSATSSNQEQLYILDNLFGN